MFNPLIELLLAVIGLYRLGLIINIILSLLINFEIANRHSPIVNKVSFVLDQIYEPLLSRIRKFMPKISYIDLSPIALFLLLDLFRSVIFRFAIG